MLSVPSCITGRIHKYSWDASGSTVSRYFEQLKDRNSVGTFDDQNMIVVISALHIF